MAVDRMLPPPNSDNNEVCPLSRSFWAVAALSMRGIGTAENSLAAGGALAGRNSIKGHRP
jgi:hypothetical protein